MRSLLASIRNLVLFNLCYRTGVKRLPYPPLLINLEPTNHCNLRCPMCPVSQNYSTVSRGFMEKPLFDQIVREVSAFRPEISLNLGGESTIHPELTSMVRTLKEAGLYVFLDTNATRLTPKLSSGLIEAGLDKIIFCLDGSSPTTYEAIRTRANFDETVENIQVFLRLRKKKGGRLPYTVVKNIQYYDPQTEPSFPKQFAKLFAECPPDEFRFTWADYWPGTHRFLLKDKYAVQPYDEGYVPCINLWKKLPISWDGLVYVCCLDLNRTTPVGSVKEEGVLGAWNSPRMRDLRGMHARGRQAEVPLCQNCNQIRRAPEHAWAGLLSAAEDRFTPWVREQGKWEPANQSQVGAKLIQIGGTHSGHAPKE